MKLEHYNEISDFFIEEVNEKIKKLMPRYGAFCGVQADMSTSTNFHGENVMVHDFFFFTDLYHTHNAEEFANILKAMNSFMKSEYGLTGYIVPGSLATIRSTRFNHEFSKFENIATEHSSILYYDFKVSDLVGMEEYKNACQKVENIESCQEPIKKFDL
jgi:hypothetical protein